MLKSHIIVIVVTEKNKIIFLDNITFFPINESYF